MVKSFGLSGWRVGGKARALIPLVAFALAGCDLGSTTIPLADPVIVVHGVLNPTLLSQTILIEESLTGKITADEKRPFDPSNPIVTSDGVPVSGAIVTLNGPEGQRTGTEARVNGRGTGVYAIPGRVTPGARYDLTISALGKTVTGATLVPKTNPPPGIPTVPFNRDHQSLNLPINDVELARAYWVRIEAPLSAFNVFTVDREVAISGDTRNLFTDDLLRVFFPGFQQTMTVAAVDTNVYDYYRSGSDPFSGVGLITHLTGGIGLFGSVAVAERRILDVTQDARGDTIEANYTLRFGAGAPHDLRLYLESKAASSTSDDRLSGNYVAGPAINPTRGAVLGTRRGTTVTFQTFEPLSTQRTNGSFLGTAIGDTIRGTMNFATTPTSQFSGAVVYVRQGK